MLCNNHGDTGCYYPSEGFFWWVETFFFNKHREAGAASDDSVSTNHSIKILL